MTTHDTEFTSRYNHARIAEQLRIAEASMQPIMPIAAMHPALTLSDAYAIQGINTAHHVRYGERVIGHKIGLTSEAMQQQLGVDQPDVGAITDRMVLGNGDAIPLDRMIAGRIEAEFAFRLGTTLPVGEPSMTDLRSAIDSVSLSAEIIDSRIADWKIGLIDTVADNASSAYIACGDWREASDDVLDALPTTVIELRVDGELAGGGPGSAVLGDPLRALLWLARTLGDNDIALESGDVVLAGAVHASVGLTAGRTYEIVGDRFGTVRLTA